MRILALQGCSNSGKTTSILTLIDLLLQDGAVITKDLKTRQAKDRALLLAYRGCTIGLTSLGDQRKNLLSLFTRAGHCDLCVCACRSRGGSFDTILEYAKEDDRFFLFKHKNLTHAEEENNETAVRLLSMIRWITDDAKQHSIRPVPISRSTCAANKRKVVVQ